MTSSRLFVVALLCVAGIAGFATAEGDAFMGDWQGERAFNDGTKAPLVAQVIALGKGEYQANLLPEFDKRVPAAGVLNGRLSDDKVAFSGGDWTGTMDQEVFKGAFKGDKPGTFSMRKVVRLSPTLGAKPPEGAVVLFDGTNTDGWIHPEMKSWLVNLKQATGGKENCAAYLRTRIYVPKAQRLKLELGTDDGVKVWMNGEVVHAKNVARGVKPGEDKVHLKLEEGWNVLMLKVTQGSGDWGACARLRPLLGDKVEGLKISPTGLDDKAVTGARATAYILDWEVAGPYTKAGVDGMGLFDVAFPPESPKAVGADWKVYAVSRATTDRSCRWKLVEGGAMQVFAGSLYTKKTCGDHELHLEFLTPFMPEKRGQGRGNSGVYIQGRYEVQILDSYGLEGRDNECGGIYKNAMPLVNMCAPPLQWQTFDVTFHAAQVDAGGNVTKKARITLVHNGVTIHDDIEINTTPGGCAYDLTKPGPLYLQDHGNPVEFRNIWVVEL